MAETIESVITTVKDEVVKVAGEVKAEVVKEEEKIRIELEDTEKLALVRFERAFLQAQVEVQQMEARIAQLRQSAEAASKSYTARLKEFITKYGIDEAKHVFNAIEGVFVKKA
jgi:hypothetical protein